jgi:hypothetical protein
MKRIISSISALFATCAIAWALQGLDLSSSNTGITGLGTGVLTALNNAVNTTGGPVTFRASTVCEINSTSAVTCNGGGSQANNGTYTPTAGATRLEIEGVGAGGGGAGSGSTPSAAGDGGNTTFSTVTANGGTKGRSDGGICTGGTVSGADFSLTGGLGGTAVGISNAYGSPGGNSKFGGAGYGGPSNAAGGAAATNSGSGGGGAGENTTALSGGGGCAGGWFFKIINSPSGTYSYTTGALGAAGGAGTGGQAGGSGAAGKIIVKEY